MVTEHDPRRSRPLRASPACCCSPTAPLAQFAGEGTPETRAKFVAWIPLGGLPLPSDATAALFFASDVAAFITGACLEVDGGRCV